MPRAITTSPEEQLQYVLTVLKHCEMNKPNFKNVAAEVKINNANSAQKKFKSIIESSGQFKLVDNQIVGVNPEEQEDTDGGQ